MGSSQPLTPSLTLIDHLTSVTRNPSRLHSSTPQKCSQIHYANSCLAHRFPFLPYSFSPPPRPSLPLCPHLSLSRPPLPSLFPLGFHPLRPSLTSMAAPQDAAAAASDSSQPSETKTIRVVIKGMVQGVFYRNWTVENATELGLKGWVRNKRAGSVEALFSGSPDSVQEMEQRCRRGPPESMVTGLQVFPSDDDPGTEFEKKPTV
ncbi:Acylphosphatase [Hibiscus syriacus]|uniref:acylphosphatase n=1 Tax=Hibiscus syriacus TaxID=106335 RepID=A0A6A2ZKR5_HIBSY|nr:uncharacterized protein LOC120143137 [Hibiscus syriacus]KAE8692498.1 Acylphosphatase [Hibiscus syriacus]